MVEIQVNNITNSGICQVFFMKKSHLLCENQYPFVSFVVKSFDPVFAGLALSSRGFYSLGLKIRERIYIICHWRLKIENLHFSIYNLQFTIQQGLPFGR